MTELPPSVRVLLPPGSVLLGPGRSPKVADPRRLARGTPVALVDNRIGSRSRLRRRAARLGLDVEREYLVLPTWGQPTFVVEDEPDLLGWLFLSLATVPPNVTRGAWLVDVVTRLLRTSWGRALASRLAPGRLLVGAPR
jgi:hypothetical protein